jgi:hypothetical protein
MTMIRNKLWSAAALLLLGCALLTKVATAVKDSNYFPVGYSNPNVKKAMYWRDSINVLQDISSFDKLYVKFHSCV